MKRTTVLAYGATLGFLSFITAAVAIAGCSSDDDQKTQPQRLSQKNEACQTSNDCVSGLACIPSRDVSGRVIATCVISDFRIAQTAKECVQIQCADKNDCCPKPTDKVPVFFDTTCEQALQRCGDSGPSSEYCSAYDRYCKCDKVDCVQEQCTKQVCTTDLECGASSALPHCSVGRCVQCIDDTHCTDGDACVNGACQPPCKVDSDCTGYNRCNAGKCVESGCLTDRECVAGTGNVEATCGTDRKCVEPCETDPDCDNGRNYSFRKCLDHKCTYMGCESDKECQYAPLGDGGQPIPDKKSKLICRDRKSS